MKHFSYLLVFFFLLTFILWLFYIVCDGHYAQTGTTTALDYLHTSNPWPMRSFGNLKAYLSMHGFDHVNNTSTVRVY